MVLPPKLVDGNTQAQRGRPWSCSHRMGRWERARGGPSPVTGGLSPDPRPLRGPLHAKAPPLGVHLPGQRPRALPPHLSRLDVDECATGLAQCAHSCLNTHGSFKCGCHAGYELGADGRQCYSEWTAGGGRGYHKAWRCHGATAWFPGPHGLLAAFGRLPCHPGAAMGVEDAGGPWEDRRAGAFWPRGPLPPVSPQSGPGGPRLAAGSGRSTLGGAGTSHPVPHPWWRVSPQGLRWRL